MTVLNECLSIKKGIVYGNLRSCLCRTAYLYFINTKRFVRGCSRLCLRVFLVRFGFMVRGVFDTGLCIGEGGVLRRGKRGWVGVGLGWCVAQHRSWGCGTGVVSLGLECVGRWLFVCVGLFRC